MTRPAPANAHFGPSQPEADAANLPNESLVASICFTTLYVFLNKRIRREYEPQCDVPGELAPTRTLPFGKVRIGHHPGRERIYTIVRRRVPRIRMAQLTERTSLIASA